jgi:uncharacterized membrane protein
LNAEVTHLSEAIHTFQHDWQQAPREKAVEAPVTAELPPSPGEILVAQSPPAEPSPIKAALREEGWEIALGMKWFSRIGIVVLLIGLVMALSYAFPMFPPEMKILSGGLLSLLFLGAGTGLHPGHSILGRILQGGGLTLGYITLYAMFFIPEAQLFEAPQMGLSFLAAYVGLMMLVAHRLNSQTTALLSLAFGYYTASYSGSEMAAYLSTALLGVAAVGLCARHANWCWVLRACFAGAMTTYFYWLGYHVGPQIHGATGDLDPKLVYLCFTYMLFHIACVVSERVRDRGDIPLLVVNTFGFYLVFLVTRRDILADGVLEGLILAIQLISIACLRRGIPEASDQNKHARFIQTCLVNALLFTGLGTLQALEGVLLPVVLVAQAVAFRELSSRGVYPRILRVATWLFFSLAYLLAPFSYCRHSEEEIILLTGGWMLLCGLYLEHRNYSRRPAWLGNLFLVLLTLAFLGTVVTVLHGYALTLACVVTGFVFLAGGFGLRQRKYRWTGLAWLVLAGGKLVLIDTVLLDPLAKILLYILLGVGLLGASLAYGRLARNRQSETSETRP